MFKLKIKREYLILIFLLFLSPVLGELLSGSTPPLCFFSPNALLLGVLLYGCGTVLIREARVRWKLQWSIIFLAVAYGIVEEALTTKAFFNTNWIDGGVLLGYGMFLGVQWSWTIVLLLFHATVSTLIPIAIVDLLWPKYKNVSLLGRRGLVFSFTGFIFIVVMGMKTFGTVAGNKMIPYWPHPFLLLGSFLIVLSLIGIAFKNRNSRITTRKIPLLLPFIFGFPGFFYMWSLQAIPNILAKSQPPLFTISIQLVEIIFVLLFVFFQIYHQDITKHHIVALIFGSILYWILLTPIYEIKGVLGLDPAQGYLIVGIVSLILLIMWRHRVLKN
ncbi:hypothetical protein KKC91_09015 [bacterium]|nr:hypothetical protein [bacterium]